MVRGRACNARRNSARWSPLPSGSATSDTRPDSDALADVVSLLMMLLSSAHAVGGQADAGGMPAGVGMEEVAIGGPHVTRRCVDAAAAQHLLAGHELAVVLADRSVGRPEPRIRLIGRRRPLPAVAVELTQLAVCRAGRRGVERTLRVL